MFTRTNRHVPAGRPAVSPFEEIRFDMYPAFARDTDEDSIPDVDDPHPLEAGDTSTIEEVELADELRKLLDVRERFEDVMQGTLKGLRELHPAPVVIKGRTKSPYSMVNKLRRKRLVSEFVEITPDMVGEVMTKGLTDVAGAMIVLPDYDGVAEVVEQIMLGALGDVVEHENFYKRPNNGYRAHHFILVRGGFPVEVQVKSDRMYRISDASHGPYKAGTLDADGMNRLTSLAAKADRGDTEAADEIDAVLSDPVAMQSILVDEGAAARPNPSTSSCGTAKGLLAGVLAYLGIKAFRAHGAESE